MPGVLSREKAAAHRLENLGECLMLRITSHPRYKNLGRWCWVSKEFAILRFIMSLALFLGGSSLLLSSAWLGLKRAGESSAATLIYNAQNEGQSPTLRQMWIDGSHDRPLDLPKDLWEADLSPDGTWLVAQGQGVDGNSDLFRVELASAQRRALTQSKEAEQSPAISPDGQWVVFTRLESDRSMQLYLLELRTGESRVLSTGGQRNWLATWAPDSRHIVFAHQIEDRALLVEMDVQSGDMTPLSDGSQLEGTPALSPDGQQIAFVQREGRLYHLHIMARDGSARRSLRTGNHRDSNPVWSPDGQWIVFSSSTGADTDLYRIRPDGSGLHLLRDATSNDEHASFSPPLDLAWGGVTPLALGLLMLCAAGLLTRREHKVRRIG